MEGKEQPETTPLQVSGGLFVVLGGAWWLFDAGPFDAALVRCPNGVEVEDIFFERLWVVGFRN